MESKKKDERINSVSTLSFCLFGTDSVKSNTYACIMLIIYFNSLHILFE